MLKCAHKAQYNELTHMPPYSLPLQLHTYIYTNEPKVRTRNVEKERQRKMQAQELLAHHFLMCLRECVCVCVLSHYFHSVSVFIQLSSGKRGKEMKEKNSTFYVPTTHTYYTHVR